MSKFSCSRKTVALSSDNETKKQKLHPIALNSVIELVSCTCKKGCKTGRCSCKAEGLSRTDLCGCFENCENTDPPMHLVNEEADNED